MKHKLNFNILKNGLFPKPYFKKGGQIKIKKSNEGKFTSYCGGKVTDECIKKAKSSGNTKLIKRATFAENAKHWKHGVR